MIGIAKKARSHGSKRLASTALALSFLLLAQPGAAAAAVYRTAGGSGSTVVSINTTYHTFSYRSTVWQDNGGSQTLAARLHLYRPNKTWYYSPWQTCTTSPGSGYATACGFGIDSVTLTSGWYYVRIQYGWLTTAGWQYGYDDGSTDPYLGWRWI